MTIDDKKIFLTETTVSLFQKYIKSKFPFDTLIVNYVKTGSFIANVQTIAGCHIITFNETYLYDDGDFDTVCDEVVRHELAHILTLKYFPYAKQDHGPEFRKMCMVTGSSGKTKVRMNTIVEKRKTKKYGYGCKCVDKVHDISGQRHSKIKKGYTYRCRNCNTRIFYLGDEN